MKRYRLILLPAVLLGACAHPKSLAEVEQTVRTKFPEVRQISTTELAAWLNDPARRPPVLLDVRAKREFAVSHLAGARQIDPDEDAAAQVPDVPKDAPIVTYCSVGYRSCRAAAQLLKAGYTNVANLEGSAFAWANEDRPLVTPDGRPTTVVHPYDANWGRLVAPEHRATIARN